MPFELTTTPNTWTPETWQQFQEILKKLEELDTKLGLANCEDPAKQAWMKSVEKRLKKLEKAKV